MNRLEKAQIIGAKLREAVKQRNLSMTDAADLAGVSRSSMRDYLSGITLPMKEAREQIADFLGITLNELNTMIGERPPKPKRPVEEICAEIRRYDDPEDVARILETATDQSVKALRRSEK